MLGYEVIGSIMCFRSITIRMESRYNGICILIMLLNDFIVIAMDNIVMSFSLISVKHLMLRSYDSCYDTSNQSIIL